MQRYAPQAYFVFHDSFNYSWDYWKDLFAEDDRHMVAMDHHGYLAWGNWDSWEDACDQFTSDTNNTKQFRDGGIEVWWGEWALATDNCAHWLGGCNDANPNPQQACKPVPCPMSYLPADQFNTEFNRDSTEPLGPWGTADQTKCSITGGICWDDSEQFTKEEVGKLATCMLKAFDANLDAQFIWTARNEIEDKWSYVKAWDNGWINTTALPNTTIEIQPESPTLFQ